MKRLLLLFGFVLLMTSCSCSRDSDDEAIEDYYLGSWELVQMTGSFHGSETTGQDMEWQERYQFNKNGSFTKRRTTNSGTKEAQGTYYIRKLADEVTLMLRYPEDNDIVASCISQHEEVLYFTDDKSLSGSWSACDGPGLLYKKVK
ncbi:hypothetical protein SLW70_11630 [Flavobacterium sp. NG2]|uniref:hypothetical protein n=1 Tax=Flavobacterium sp. NG2 TaxID=3097547 RepID=UPI002A831CCF|nr:hypothetical protein [Flavobacterium sp. NG2]WPR70582.1 hypothetical protein SLW70_11630 [Flavobacterium sp. NG2]